MLLRFTVENFKSFQGKEEFSMIPSKVSRHNDHVIPPSSRSDIGVLKASVIYGANASGKSNIIKAMHHAQLLITEGKRAGQSLPYEPFKLAKSKVNSPSRFEFEIKCNNVNYAYGFIADHKSIYEEWLFEIDKTKDIALYERRGDEFDLSGLSSRVQNDDDENFLSFTGLGTPSNRLFLFECFERNVFKQLTYLKCLKDVFDWFKHKLNIIFPDTKYHGLEMELYEDNKTAVQLANILRDFDTGISQIKLHELDFESEVNLPNKLKSRIESDLEENEAAFIASPSNRYQIKRDEQGKISAYKLMTSHIDTDGDEVLFDLIQESDGTQRLLDLAPGLIDLLHKDSVYIIDELDRSLHSDVTSTLMATFLSKTQGKHSQLIVTTHETNLLNLELLRRDEIWFTAKNKSGSSKIYSLEEYKPRFDRDIRKAYLAGRFGAVPRIRQLLNSLSEDDHYAETT